MVFLFFWFTFCRGEAGLVVTPLYGYFCRGGAGLAVTPLYDYFCRGGASQLSLRCTATFVGVGLV